MSIGNALLLLGVTLCCSLPVAAALNSQFAVAPDGKSLKVGGSTFRPIDDSAVFFYEVPGSLGCPMPDPGVDLNAALERHGFHGVVRCRLTDYVDCSGESHGFKESGGSRVLRVGESVYRITQPAGKLGWFSYELATNPKPGKPHLVVCQLINDRERYTTVTLNQAEGTTWAAPYEGEEKYVPKNQEGDTWRCDVGSSVYTGREYHCDGKPFTFSMLFYPKTERAKVTISHRANEAEYSELNGAAVARMWVFDILDPLPDAVASKPSPAERTVALYIPHPWFLYAHFGIPARTPEQRVKSMEETVRYLEFCGFNQLQLHIVNGSDRAGMAWYDSKLYPNLEGDLFKELLPIAEREGVEIVPIVAPLQPRWNKSYAEAPTVPDEMGWTRDSCCLDRDGKDFTRAFGAPAPNPLRPEVQEWQFRIFREILDRCAKSPAVPAVGFRVNGKIGLCFSGEGWDKCGQDAGYNQWMVDEFTKDTGIQVPKLEPTSYQWIKDNCWDKWLQWRCDRMRKFWIECRDLIKSYRPDLKFIAACDLPSEWPGYNIEWPSGDHSVRDLFRHHGYDPELYTNDDGIWIQRGMMVGSDRYWYDTWFPPKANAWAHKMFNYAPGVAESYQTKEPSSVELYHNYWEEDPHPDNEYGPTMRTATPVAYGDFFYEPIAYSLRKANVERVVFMGWERAVSGHEHDLRRFARAFRAIPRVEPKDFDGEIKVVSEGPQVPESELPEGYKKPEADVLWAKWYGDRLVIANDAFCSRKVCLSLSRPLKQGEAVLDHGSGQSVHVAEKPGQAKLELDLRPFDLRVLSVSGQPAQAKPAAQQAEKQGVTLDLTSAGDITAGSQGTLGLTLTNGSKAAIRDVILSARLPRGWQEVPGDARTLGSLAPGKSHSFKVRISIPIDAAGVSGEVKATVSYAGAGGRATVEASALACAPFPIEVSQKTPSYHAAAGEVVRPFVTLRNLDAKPVTGKVSVELPEGWAVRELSEITLEPGQSLDVPIDAAIPETASARRSSGAARFVIDGTPGDPAAIGFDVVLKCPRAAAPPAIDGRLSEWPAEAVVIDSSRFRLGEGATASTLSSVAPSAWLSWDDTALYIAIRVSDTDYRNPFSANEMWKGDSVQFGIDVRRAKSGPRGFFEYGLSSGSDGQSRVWRFRAAAGLKEGGLPSDGTAVLTSREGTVYEAAIKWGDLGFTPQTGDLIGVALAVNDYDGSVRRCLTFAEGLTESKDPTKFVGLRLEH